MKTYALAFSLLALMIVTPVSADDGSYTCSCEMNRLSDGTENKNSSFIVDINTVKSVLIPCKLKKLSAYLMLDENSIQRARLGLFEDIVISNLLSEAEYQVLDQQRLPGAFTLTTMGRQDGKFVDARVVCQRN